MTNLFRLLAVLAALVLSAGLITACGGDDDEGGDATTESSEALSPEDYASEVQAILEPLGTNLQSLGDTISASGDASALAEGIGEAQAELEDAADQIEALSPPEDATTVNADLVAAIQGFADTLEATRQAAEDEDLEALQSAALELPTEAQDFAAELAEIQQAAIDAGIPIEEPTATP